MKEFINRYRFCVELTTLGQLFMRLFYIGTRSKLRLGLELGLAVACYACEVYYRPVYKQSK